MEMQPEQRSHPRLECTGSADVYLSATAAPCSAKIKNLSIEGCLIVLDTPQNTSRGATVELAFNINQLPFRVRAEVRVVQLDTTMGVHFMLLSDRVRGRLQDLIEELTEDALKYEANKKQSLRLRALAAHAL